jgi:aspartyl-tRNA(Asn)/glutamyl-tRNA(Gln) amidotransferase subunit B
MTHYGLPDYDAGADRWRSRTTMKPCAAVPQPKVVSNWVMGDMMLKPTASTTPPAGLRDSPQLADLLRLIDDGVLSGKIAKTVFEAMYRTGKPAKTIVAEQGLVQMSDSAALEAVITKILADNAAQVADYRAGKQKVFGFFVGQTMKATQGKANPALVNALLRKLLD